MINRRKIIRKRGGIAFLQTICKNSIPPFLRLKSPTNPRYNAEYVELEIKKGIED